MSDLRVILVLTAMYLNLLMCVAKLRPQGVDSVFYIKKVMPQKPLMTYADFVDIPGGSLPKAVLIYSTCDRVGVDPPKFSIERSTIPSVRVECNPETNFYDCNEAVPYLNFIIEHYDEPIAEKYIFAHGHDQSWHYQGDFFDALGALLDSTYFRKMTYGGVFRGQYYTGPWGQGEEWWARSLYKYVFRNTSMPPNPVIDENQRPCCATFWLNSKFVKNRKKEEYIWVRNRLQSWSRENSQAQPNPAWYCGRTMEYNWHILFTKTSYIEECLLCQGAP